MQLKWLWFRGLSADQFQSGHLNRRQHNELGLLHAATDAPKAPREAANIDHAKSLHRRRRAEGSRRVAVRALSAATASLVSFDGRSMLELLPVHYREVEESADIILLIDSVSLGGLSSVLNESVQLCVGSKRSTCGVA